MGSTFNLQILEEKLSKLNPSQQCIETLSHWCIFHMSKAKQVIETWGKQFHSSRHEQRLPLLYLANDILQNSRRKGSEFVAEFRKVLPGALRDVMKNGDELGRNAVLRLIGIWEERKVFVSKGQSLKEELLGRQLDNSNKELRSSSFKLMPATRSGLGKIVLGYESVYGGPIDEFGIMRKCSNAVSCMQKVNKGIGAETDSEKLKGSSIFKEFEGHHDVLKDCIEQLTAVESSRANLMSDLREALQEQELKMEQIRRQIKVARSQSEKADAVKMRVLNGGTAELLPEQNMAEPPSSVGKSGKDTNSTSVVPSKMSTASNSSAKILTNAKTGASSSSNGLTPSGKKPASPSSFSSDGLIPSGKKFKQDHDSLDMPPPPPSSPPPLQPPPPPPPPLAMHPYSFPYLMQTAAPLNFSYSYGPSQPPSFQPLDYPSSGVHQVVNSASAVGSGYSDYYTSNGAVPPPNVAVYQGPVAGFYGQAWPPMPTNGQDRSGRRNKRR